ncbi:MAG: hypothetical protein WEE89_17185 [Gemmatimonadota bacterium]
MRAIVLRGLVTAIAVSGIGWLARAPYTPPGSDTAVLRLSWRLMPERTEHCRRLSQEELEKLPIHMRNPTVCEREVADHRLIVQIDDEAPDTTRLLPMGAHGDRPIFVLQERELAPGAHRVRVWFGRESGEREHEREEHEERRREQSALRLDTNITARPGQVELVTLDPVAQQLVHVTHRSRG